MLLGLLSRNVGYNRIVVATGGLPEPLSRWTLAETAGTTIVDAKGVQDGTISGDVRLGLPPLTAGGAFRVLPEQAGKLLFPNNATWRNAGWAVRAVGATTQIGGQQIIAEWGSSSPTSPGIGALEIWDGLAAGWVRDGLALWFGGQSGQGVSGATLTPGEPFDLVMAGGPDGAKLYLNGAQIAQVATTVGWQNMEADLVALVYGSPEVSPFRGVADLIEVYGQQLTAAQVLELYERNVPKPALDAFDLSVTVETEDFVDLDLFGGNNLAPAGTTYGFTQPASGSATDQGGGVVRYTAPAAAGDTGFAYTLTHDGRQMTAGVAVSVQQAGQTLTADAGTMGVFSHTRVDFAALTGKTAVRVLEQGGHVNGYVRRSGKKATDVGRIDLYARERNTGEAKDAVRVLCTDNTEVELRIEVADPIPGGTVRYLNAESGSNGNNGQSPGQAWQTWAHAIASMPSNATLVVKARQSNGRDMVYPVTVVGGSTPSLPVSGVTVMADPADVAQGNRPKIWSHGNVFRAFYDDLNSGKWELHHSGSSTYRSVATNMPNPYSWGGLYKGRDGRWYRLLDYKGNLSQLTSTSFSTGNPNNHSYIGPGVVRHTDGRIYIRLTPPPTGNQGSHDPRNRTPAWSWDDYRSATPSGTLTTNPNQVEILLGVCDPDKSANVGLLSLGSRTNTRWKNLDFVGAGWPVRANSNVSGLQMLGCRWLAQANPQVEHFTSDQATHWTYMVTLDGGSDINNLLFDRCQFWGGIPPWLSYHGLKGMIGAPEMSARMTVFFLGNSGSTTFRRNSNVIRNSEFHGLFAFSQGDANPGFAFLFHHNLMHDTVIDGGYVGRRTDAPIYFIRNLGYASLFYSYTANNSVSGWTDQGKIYEVYNLIIRVRPSMWRSGTATSNPPWAPWPGDLPHGSSSEPRGHPRKRAYCTIVTSNGSKAKGSQNGIRGQGCQITPGFEISNIETTRTFNNIYAAVPGPQWGLEDGTHRSRDSTIGYYVADSYRPWAGAPSHIQAIHDGNHLWRAPGMPSESGINALTCVRTGSGDVTISSLSALQSHGFEANGSVGDPLWEGPVAYPTPYGIDRFMLQEGSPCETGALNITGQNWGTPLPGGAPPDMDGNTMVPLLHQPHRGAVDPDIPLIEQDLGPL